MNNLKQEIKLVLTDLDGTVVYPEAHEVSEQVIQSIRTAEQQGVKFVAVTGRSFHQTKQILQQINFQDPCIFDGGAIIVNPITEETLWQRKVPIDTTKRAVEILLPHAKRIDYGTSQTIRPDKVDINDITDSVLSIWAAVPAETTMKLVKELNQLPDVIAHSNAGPGGDYTLCGIQVTHFEADKSHAVTQLLAILNVDSQYTLAIGDGDNDIPFFQNAALKVAMGNATELLKEISDVVVSTVQENGFAEAISKFVIRETTTGDVDETL